MRFAVSIKQNISRLDVSMEDAVLVRIMHGARQLRDDFRRSTDWHRFAPNNFIKLSALHKFHTKVTGTLALPDLVNRDNARMV